MRPLPALLLAVLFVTAAAAFPVAGTLAAPERSPTTAPPLQSIETVENTTNQLTIPSDEVRRTSYNDTGIDVGSTTRAWSAELQHRHEALAFEERFRRTDGREARARLITDRLAAIDSEERALDRRQDRAIARYARGEITAATFLRTRLVVDAEASELLETLESIQSAPDRAPGYSLNESMTTRIRAVEGELRTLTGPVGTQLRSDGATDRRYYVEASDDGYMLATITDDDYIRETRLDGARDGTTYDRFLSTAVDDSDPETDRLDIADQRAAELYPWLYERQRPSFTYYGNSGIYELTASHPNGDLKAYLDGGTTDVFYEEQFRDLSDVRTRAIAREVNGTLAVTARQSSATGPLLVTASNNETDAAVDGTVSINGNSVGSTGSDGVLWTIEPRGSYTVTVTTDGRTTSVVVPAN